MQTISARVKSLLSLVIVNSFGKAIASLLVCRQALSSRSGALIIDFLKLHCMLSKRPDPIGKHIPKRLVFVIDWKMIWRYGAAADQSTLNFIVRSSFSRPPATNMLCTAWVLKPILRAKHIAIKCKIRLTLLSKNTKNYRTDVAHIAPHRQYIQQWLGA